MNKDYVYDCETNTTTVYRNKYTGKGIHIPKGEITNGDMLKAIFPNIQTRNENTDFITYSLDGIVGTCVEAKWWNSPYERNE